MFKVENSKCNNLENLQRLRGYLRIRIEHYKTELAIVDRRIKQEERRNANEIKNIND